MNAKNFNSDNAHKERLISTATALISIAVLIVMAMVMPITPDEVSRLDDAEKFIRNGVFEFYWPPLLIFLSALCKSLSLNYLGVRLVYIAFESVIIVMLATYAKGRTKIILFFLLPYFGLVLAIASPQGLMIALLGLLILTIQRRAWLWSTLLISLLYLVNPLCILILPPACFIYYLWSKSSPKIFYASLAAYALLVPLIGKIFVDTGKILPTFSSNGAINLYLGNNPSKNAFRGAWDENIALQNLGSIDYNEAVRNYLAHDPAGFTLNILKKLAYYPAPFDLIRSNIGKRYDLVMYTYIGIAQILIYWSFLTSYKKSDEKSAYLFSTLIFLGSWLAYSIFFVKIRFRIPFDFLLFMTYITFSQRPHGLWKHGVAVSDHDTKIAQSND